jgi:hypothetical protein
MRDYWNQAITFEFMSDTPPSPDRIVLALVRDLIFASRITAAAQSAGIGARIIRDPAMLQSLSGSLLLADLNQPGVIAASKQWKDQQRGRVIGFVSHVDGPTIEAARQAGLDQILARSGFVQQLPQLLADFARQI